MNGWNYAVEIFDGNDLEIRLNDMGAQGWELVTVMFIMGAQLESRFRCVFKKPMPVVVKLGEAK